MPKLLKGLDKKHPSLAAVLRDLRNVKTELPKVFSTYVDYSGMTAQQAHVSLYPVGLVMANRDPFELKRIPSIGFRSNIRGYARFSATGTLYVHTAFAKQYQALMAMTGQGIRPYQERATFLMKAKILHEMVHWARTEISNLPDLNWEYGDEFEWVAYGKIPTATNLQLRDYINVPGNQ